MGAAVHRGEGAGEGAQIGDLRGEALGYVEAELLLIVIGGEALDARAHGGLASPVHD